MGNRLKPVESFNMLKEVQMSPKRKVLAALAALLVLLLYAGGMADMALAELESISDQPYQHWLEGDEVSSQGTPGVPRNQILLEIFTRTT
jgi:hypothetical protein